MDKPKLGKEGMNFMGTGTHFMTFYESQIANPRNARTLDLQSLDKAVLAEAQRRGLPILRPHFGRGDREPDYIEMMKQGFTFAMKGNSVFTYHNDKVILKQVIPWLREYERVPEPIYEGENRFRVYEGRCP